MKSLQAIILSLLLCLGTAYAEQNGLERNNLEQNSLEQNSPERNNPEQNSPEQKRPGPATTPLTQVQLANLFTHHAKNKQLSTLASRLQLGQQAKGEFQQTRYLAVLKRPLKSAGLFVFSQDMGLLWKQTSPFTSTLVLKQNTLIQQDSLGNITQSQANQASSAMAEQLPQLMQALLSGDVEALAQGFDLFMVTDNSDSQVENLATQKLNWQLGLVAKDPLIQQAIGAMALEGNHQIDRLTMLSALPVNGVSMTGDKTIISFSNVVQQLTEADLHRFELSNEADINGSNSNNVTPLNSSDSEAH